MERGAKSPPRRGGVRVSGAGGNGAQSRLFRYGGVQIVDAGRNGARSRRRGGVCVSGAGRREARTTTNGKNGNKTNRGERRHDRIIALWRLR